MSLEVAEIVSQIERQGGQLTVNDAGRVMCSIPDTPDAQATIENLRSHRDEVVAYLTHRRERAIAKLNEMVIPEGRVADAPKQCPLLPAGVRLISYHPRMVPIEIDTCSVVFNVEKFICAELRELDARLHNPVQIRGGFGLFAILDRLRQAGLELEIAPDQRRDPSR